MQILCRGQWHALDSLYLDGNDIDVTGIGYLKQSSWSRLSSLTLGKNVLCTASWATLGLAPSDMSRVMSGKTGQTIQVQRELSSTDTVWPRLKYVNFVTRGHHHTSAWVKLCMSCVYLLYMFQHILMVWFITQWTCDLWSTLQRLNNGASQAVVVMCCGIVASISLALMIMFGSVMDKSLNQTRIKLFL